MQIISHIDWSMFHVSLWLTKVQGAVAPHLLEENDDIVSDDSGASNDLAFDIEQKIEDEAFRCVKIQSNNKKL